MSKEIYDITIIGAGPVGLYAGFYAGMRSVKTQIIESLPQVGGQLQAIYPEKYIHDVAGHTKVKASELVEQLSKQVEKMPEVEIKVGQSVTNIEKVGDNYLVTTDKGAYETKSIILATGNGSFNPRQLAADVDKNLVNEEERIFYHVDKLDNYKGLDVVVAGGGDSAIDIAMMLGQVANKVYLVHRRKEFRALEESVRQLHLSGVEVLTPYKFNNIQDAEDAIEINLTKVKSQDEERTISVDKLIVNYGFLSDNSHSKNWQIDLNKNRGLYEVDSLMETNMPLIYAIGDGATYPGKLKLISQGFGEGPTAVNQIVEKLYPKNSRIVHSTSLF
ncbi:ferredoxin--NADP(+) reductase [Floricoccus tropicus]|uniref:Ferredoxin--NADP reductase n=1 Tax=Floricoccus tropicus TaxID=1859473 RepID=A0A1E8GMG6_9LACT|nr:NAD(P)/FAD-dependent oxidoreductase [Floricoccus tropicus]OFI49367.1 ferredoxin--NADP(+) reductase [Floricoccus tropicus]